MLEVDGSMCRCAVCREVLFDLAFPRKLATIQRTIGEHVLRHSDITVRAIQEKNQAPEWVGTEDALDVLAMWTVYGPGRELERYPTQHEAMEAVARKTELELNKDKLNQQSVWMSPPHIRKTSTGYERI